MKKLKLIKTLLIPIIGITSISTIAAVSTSCSSVVHVTGVSLDKESLTLGIGDSDILTATVLPENATNKSVNWTSSNNIVATVDNNGEVTAVSEGQATITVTTNDGGFTATCQVTVNQEIIHVIGVWLDKESLTLGEGGSKTLHATLHPENATDKSVTWSSSDSSVATVDDNGKVTAVSDGSAKITVKTNDGGCEDYCDVAVAAPYVCVTAHADSTLELINVGGTYPNLQYSDDRKIWHNYSGTISIPTDSIFYLKGDNPTGWSESDTDYSTLFITGDVSISGNVMGLLNNGTGSISSIPNDYCFFSLFGGSEGITSVSQDFLSADTLKPNCYNFMFYGCTSLTSAPLLLATTLANYCYTYMFYGCTSLTTAPDLPATTLADGCYEYMFNDCSSLTTVPDLPAQKLADLCYYSMFKNCTSLTQAPTLPATTLAFGCYAYMFNGCTHLASVRIGYTGTVADTPTSAFDHWVNGVAPSGTFYYKGSDTLANFGFPSSWTINPN